MRCRVRKKLSCQHQRDPHQKQYVSLPFGGAGGGEGEGGGHDYATDQILTRKTLLQNCTQILYSIFSFNVSAFNKGV